MYEVYLFTGIVLSLAGLATIFYWLWYVKNRKYERLMIISLSQAIGLVIIGGFYIYSRFTMSSLSFSDTDYINGTNLILQAENTTQDAYFDVTELNSSITSEEDGEEILYTQELPSETPPTNISNNTSQFLLKYQQLIKNMLNNRSTNQRQLDINHNDTCSSYFETFLQDAMLVYSFVHGLITLINSAIDCKTCDNNSKISRKESKVETPKSILTSNKLLIRLLMLWLVPPLTASSLYFTMTSQETPTSQIKTIIQHPTNVSTATNENQVDKIIQNIYRIVKQAKTHSIPHIPTPPNPVVRNQTCYTPNIYLKLHTFVVFILGYFTVLLYSQLSYVSTNKDMNYLRQAKNLKVSLVGFGALWLPSALDMLTRVYLTEGSPGLVTQLLSAVGNCNHILTNISYVMTARDVIKSKSRVQPVEE